jgi:hypothetical protein
MLVPEPLEVEPPPPPPHAHAPCGAAKKMTAALANPLQKMSRAIEASFHVPSGPATSQPTASLSEMQAKCNRMMKRTIVGVESDFT